MSLEEKIDYLQNLPKDGPDWERKNAQLGQIYTWVQDEEISFADFRILLRCYQQNAL